MEAKGGRGWIFFIFLSLVKRCCHLLVSLRDMYVGILDD